jgi:hypothetical protein
MSRLKIRHFHRVPHVFCQGEPDPEYRWYSIIVDEGGYWVVKPHYDHIQEQRRERRRQERREKIAELGRNRPLFGPGSGREGGGRGHWHAKYHRRVVNNDTLALGCPICRYGAKLFRFWINTDYGRWNEIWESWLEDQFLRRALARKPKKERRSLMGDPGRLHQLKQVLLKAAAENGTSEYDELKCLKFHLEQADEFFDAYMRVHHDEAKGPKGEDVSVFYHLGIPFVYDRPLPTKMHEEVFSTKSHTTPEGDLTELAIMHGNDFLPNSV